MVLAICGGNLFRNETKDGKNDLSYALTRSNMKFTKSPQRARRGHIGVWV